MGKGREGNLALKFEVMEFVPVMLGSDINTYSMARAFYEAYKIKSIVIGKADTGPSCNSKIIDFFADSELDRPQVFIKVVNELAAKYQDQKVILIGCGDNYVEQIIQNKDHLRENIIAPYIDEDLMRDLLTKEKFYQMCDKHNLDYPRTFIYTRNMGENIGLPFDFPVILKPSSGIMYWEHEFPGQKKVYRLNNMAELKKVIDQIYQAGYEDNLIIQDFIPGDDSYMRVMTTFSGRDKKIQLMSMGHALLEEHTPHGLGNTSAIINDYNEELSARIKGFLEGIGYEGLANFDIKYDQRDGKYKIFEINVRQGRNNYYVTGAGYNLAQYVVNEYIYNKRADLVIANNDFLWTVIPVKIVFQYVKKPQYLERVKQLIKDKKVFNPLFLRGDSGLKRLVYLYKSHLSHFYKYKKYYP
ncbi:MAG: ATP-grasp domain-containing protein [Candidatus Saccharibacteria bacterium]